VARTTTNFPRCGQQAGIQVGLGIHDKRPGGPVMLAHVRGGILTAASMTLPTVRGGLRTEDS
jgi:hypothetical protein